MKTKIRRICGNTVHETCGARLALRIAGTQRANKLVAIFLSWVNMREPDIGSLERRICRMLGLIEELDDVVLNIFGIGPLVFRRLSQVMDHRPEKEHGLSMQGASRCSAAYQSAFSCDRTRQSEIRKLLRDHYCR